ncbi:MAG: zinc-ribbon domain-containing protein [Verrucomicrobiota bacterium]|nr:zinc-ribbon domain-containing protein [Verrucomicrobiota bacterium]
MENQPQIDQQHEHKKRVIRKIGMVFVAVGGIFTLIGIGSFFMAFGGGGWPRYFWCAFIGLPMLGFGKILLSMGYMGAIARYTAGEVAPVTSDTFNYMAHNTKDGIRTVATSLGEGLAAGMHGPAQGGTAAVRCRKCGADNEESARFCDQCGASLPERVDCQSCGEQNDRDARFCDNCGKPLH